jgi:DNA-binding NarL/FixJ family response regulator
MTQNDVVVRILLAHGQSLFRDAIKSALESERDLSVVSLAGDGPQAVAEAQRIQPDVAILDADLPRYDGAQTTRMIKESVPGCRVLLLSDVYEPEILLRAVDAGVTGFMRKEAILKDLVKSTRLIANDETVIPRALLGPLLANLVHRRRKQDEAHARISRLTKRERQVLSQLAEGCDNDAIARNLFISPETARTHIQNVLNKLGVHSRLEAAALALQNGNLEYLLEQEDVRSARTNGGPRADPSVA